MTAPAKKHTVSALLRKVQRLEAQIAELQAALGKSYRARGEYMLEAVDLRLRIKQAQAILNGEDA